MTIIMTTKTKKDQGTGRFITDPLPLDILCGKTKDCTVHPGTRRFRVVIESYKESYAKSLTKFDKMSVTLTIYDILSNASSRFLKWNKTHSAWEELSVAAARDKVGHALRFANRETNQQEKAKIGPIVLPSMNPSQSLFPPSLNQTSEIDSSSQECYLQQSISHTPPPPFGSTPLATTKSQQASNNVAAASPLPQQQQPTDNAAAAGTSPLLRASPLLQASLSPVNSISQIQTLGSLVDMATTMKLASDTISLLNSINDTATSSSSTASR